MDFEIESATPHAQPVGHAHQIYDGCAVGRSAEAQQMIDQCGGGGDWS
jgi:hypothetical protein